MGTTLQETPSGNRLIVGIFETNSGKPALSMHFPDSLSPSCRLRKGTTTDPVSMAMEIAPLGPCVLIDTADLTMRENWSHADGKKDGAGCTENGTGTDSTASEDMEKELEWFRHFQEKDTGGDSGGK